jgi:hypothetical protein
MHFLAVVWWFMPATTKNWFMPDHDDSSNQDKLLLQLIRY